MVVQLVATVDQMQQLITEDKLFSIVKNMVNEVLSPYLGRLQNLKLTNPVSIHGDPESSRGAEICNNIQGHHDSEPVALYMKDYGGGFEFCNPSDCSSMGKNVKKNKDEDKDTDKDKGYRERLAICNKAVGEVISKLLDGDNSYLTTGCVLERMMAVMKAKYRLQDPRFILQFLRKLMEPIIAENASVGVQDAFQVLESFLMKYANPVQKKRSAKHLPDSISLTASQKEMVLLEATVDPILQLTTKDKLFSIVENMVNQALGPYLGRLQNLKLTNPVSIHGDPESSRGAEICNNIQGYLDVDPVALYMKDHGGGFELCNLSDDKIYDDSGEGTSGARANPHNMELSQENSFTVGPVLPSLPCSDMENFGGFGLCDLSDDEIYGDWGEGTSDARANQLIMNLSQENTFTVQGCADIQNTLPAVAEVHHNPVMHGVTKKSAEAKGKRTVEEIKDEAYIKKGKMKLVNDN